MTQQTQPEPATQPAATTADEPADGRQTLPCDVDELRSLFLFEKLDDEQLAWLCREGRVEVFPPGPVYAEGEPATCFYVLIEGALVMSRRIGGDNVEVNRSSQRGAYTGAFRAYLGDRVPQVYDNSLRVTQLSRFYVLDADKFAWMMRDWFPMAVHLLEGLFFGIKNVQQAGRGSVSGCSRWGRCQLRPDPRAEQSGRRKAASGPPPALRDRVAGGAAAVAPSWRAASSTTRPWRR